MTGGCLVKRLNYKLGSRAEDFILDFNNFERSIFIGINLIKFRAVTIARLDNTPCY